MGSEGGGGGVFDGIHTTSRGGEDLSACLTTF